MNILHLKTLAAIADYGTFGAAGEAIFLIQSIVSQQVRAKEKIISALHNTRFKLSGSPDFIGI
jgi:DNA-binding transcriptional LysR family regulator